MNISVRNISLPVYLIAFIWLVNGVLCKVLNLVPRHQAIVARILGEEISVPATFTIGVLEILMSVWILSGIYSRFCIITQVVIIMTMNILELMLTPDLLLFGHYNILFAIVFCLFIIYFQKKNHLQSR